MLINLGSKHTSTVPTIVATKLLLRTSARPTTRRLFQRQLHTFCEALPRFAASATRMRADRVLTAVAKLAESANDPKDPPTLAGSPCLPLTESVLLDLLRQMPDVRPVGSMIRSLYPDRKARAALVLALYGKGGAVEERLKTIVDALDLLGEHVARARAANRKPVADGVQEASTPGPSGSASNTADQQPHHASAGTNTVLGPAFNPHVSPAASLASNLSTTAPATSSKGKEIPNNTPPRKPVRLEKLILRIAHSRRLDTSMIRIFRKERERLLIRIRMKRFSRCSLERWTLLAGIVWCLDKTDPSSYQAYRG
ncbi:hypothetical protein EV426DRAFT_707336 [Tirmania nivea]|nr:hypothetical protein EV426DRAFT_707336 [Tirmania nivea]